MDGHRPGFPALKAGAGSGVWDNSTPDLKKVRWNISEFIWKLSLTGERKEEELTERVVSPILFF